MKENKLNLAFVDYGLGKYYTWTDKGKIYPFIEMNLAMLHFDIKLFCWVFNHELKHYLFYRDPKHRGRRNRKIELAHMAPTPKNLRMMGKLFKFEMKYPIQSHLKRFIVLNNKGVKK